MIWVFDFETPANTLATAKQVTRMEMGPGIINKIEIVIPPGPSHLLHLQICDAVHQVWPTNAEADFAGDNDVIDFEDEYELTQPPFELQAWTWNEDEAWPHRVIIRIGMTPAPALPEFPAPFSEEGEIQIPSQFL